MASPLRDQYPTRLANYWSLPRDDRWQGIIKLRDWFHHVAPDLAALSSKAYSSEQLKALFMTTPRPFELGIEELSYQKLQAIGLLDADQISPALMCKSLNLI